jgi:ribose transport system ATP-binding protein
MTIASENVLSVSGLNKSYNVPVLTDFDFDLRKGEVHALIGSNGAGKSTFAKILTGLTPRNSGTIHFQNRAYQPQTKQEASAAGINMVLQELNIIPTLSVAENLFLHALPHYRGILDRKGMRKSASGALKRLGLDDLDPDQRAGSLGVGQQQLVEIAGALAQNSSVLILDEPTAALTDPEINRLFENINQLRQEDVAMIYISHRMDEIFRIADRVTVLRDGRRISTHDTGSTQMDELVREMAGNELAERRPHLEVKHQGPALRVKGLKALPTVKAVSFEVQKGEILGIAGLIGAGRTETLRAIFGADPKQSGEIYLAGQKEPLDIRSPQDALQAGIGLIPEDRKNDGLLLTKSVTVNTTLSTLTTHTRAGLIQHGSELKATDKASQQLDLKRDSLEQSVSELSGGNQQKVVMGRWLLCDCEVLLFDEPTRGIDVASKETIYNALDKLASEGKALVVVSSDLMELMTISHRILVMSAGRITGSFSPDTWTQEAITTASFSAYLNPNCP